jgi:nicotinate-nucleotide--dimethylbenzimidazole phosphoribosyltransferase
MTLSGPFAPDVPTEIQRAIAAVEPPDPQWAARASERHSRLTMPSGSLGRLLDVGRQLAAIQRTVEPVTDPALVAIFAGDHGVAAEGVSAYPSEVTGQMVLNYLRGGAAVNVFARRVGATVRVVDLGLASAPDGLHDHSHLIRHPMALGTRNFLHEPAMTREFAFAAFAVGLRLAERWTSVDGARVIALGEMGIANTTSASALVAGLLGAASDRVVGRGTGVDDPGLARKRNVIAQALKNHGDRITDEWDWISRVGGFEIIGLAGLAVGAARRRAVVILDGLISTTAGLIATRLCPPVRGSLISASLSPEPAHRIALDAMDLRPLLDLNLRLGEGTGATLAIPLIACSAGLLRDMATFDSAGVSGPSA